VWRSENGRLAVLSVRVHGGLSGLLRDVAGAVLHGRQGGRDDRPTVRRPRPADVRADSQRRPRLPRPRRRPRVPPDRRIGARGRVHAPRMLLVRPLSGSGTFRKPLLFPWLRRFVYVMRRDAGL